MNSKKENAEIYAEMGSIYTTIFHFNLLVIESQNHIASNSFHPPGAAQSKSLFSTLPFIQR